MTMSQTNVIITSGSKNQIIHVPVVTSTTRSVTPIENVSPASGSFTLSQTNNTKITLKTNSDRNPSYSQKQSVLSQSQSTPSIKTGATNKELFSDDNSEVKTLYVNSETNNSREQLLLPTDTFIKEEVEDDEYEEYESMDEVDIEGIVNAKTQYKCSGCGKGFCYKGWLDKHKQSSPGCRNAHPIAEKSYATYNINRERPSLEGRLNELLCCPNENCSFTTHWVQSLNKHVFTACKFGKPNSDDVLLRTSGRRSLPQNQNNNQTNVCHLCNKSFNDSALHTQHMKNTHQIKLLYQCSECKMNFETKHESEVHIEEQHNTNEEGVPLRTYSKVDNPLNGVQQCWNCDSCNKSYLSLRSYDIHRESCEKASIDSKKSLNKSGPTISSTISKNAISRTFPKNNNSMKHFKREQIEAIHVYDFECRFCHKEFDDSKGLCNHLSRRPFCRDWYYTHLPDELKKRNSLHLMAKGRNKVQNGFGQSRPNKHGSEKLSTNWMPRTKRVVARKKSYESPEAKGKPNSARCNRCRKIFVGKNPTVALTNHLRGSTCVPAKYNSSHKPEIVRSRNFNKPKNNGKPHPTKSLSENRFYCKLCEKLELKNRVSLGCHLTIYHGLPPVNVSNEDGDAFRCQTCSQVFDSKYFYNVHRQDCDLTSPYVGIVSGDEISQIHQNNGQPIEDEDMRDSSGMTCGLCGRTGFSSANQVNMHQKYQCVKRHQKKTNQKRYQPSKSQKMAKIENNGTLTCDQCGRGPYNSFSHYLEHKKKYCNALKDVGPPENNMPELSDGPNPTKKPFVCGTASSTSASKENFCLNPTIPRARKTINFANASSPQVSHDSSAPMDTNENEMEEVVPIVSQVTKCSVCPEEFEDILAFIRHRLGHLTEELTINESVDAIDCELCGARVHHYQRIQQHLILHLQNVQILKKKNLIEVMKRKQHRDSEIESDDEDQDSSQLHCPYCKSEYSSRTELANHIKKTCPFRYQCSTCNNTYSAKESYLEHRDYCSKNSNSVKTVVIAPTYKCRNCNVEFQIKQQLLWHEHACNKVYAADHSGRVEEVIERTLTCSVCGLVSDVYDRKVKHERQCLQRFLTVIGNSTEEIESNSEELLKPLTNKMDFDLTSLSNTSDSSEVPEDVINNLKEEHGIKKDLKIVLTGFDEQLIRKLKNQIYSESDETNQFEALKVSFMTLVRRLTKNDEILFEMSQESSAEVLLTRMLKYLGEQPIQHNGLNELNCFRQNLQTFLKLTIKDDTLILAYREAESVDEAIVNMLNFECEFDS